jgi:hypothetical protein
MRWVALLVVAAIAACSSSKPPQAAAPTPVVAHPRPPTLLDHVPAETPFLFSAIGGSAFTGARVHDVLEQMRAKAAPTLAGIDEDTIAHMPASERLGYAALKLMATITADDLARLGFDPARTEMVAYTVGLTPVVRLRLDGAFLRRTFARALADARYDLPALRHGAHEYWTWTTESGLQFVLVILDDQAVIAVTRRAERILDHMIGAGANRPARPFELSTVAARYPQLEGVPILYLDPVRLAALVEQVEEVRLIANDVTPACARAVAGFLRTFPPIAATMGEPDRKTRTSRFIIGPSPALARALAPLVRPIPRWPADPGEKEMILGFGFAPLPALEAAAEYIDEIAADVQVCSDKPPGSTLRASLGAIAPVLATMNGSTFVMHEIPETDDMPVKVEILADVTDPYAMYSWFASNLGLPARPPTLGTPTPISFGFLPSMIVLESRSIAATLGQHDADAFDRLRRAPAGPAAVLALSMGAGLSDSNPHGTTHMTARLDGDLLVFDMVERSP